MTPLDQAFEQAKALASTMQAGNQTLAETIWTKFIVFYVGKATSADDARAAANALGRDIFVAALQQLSGRSLLALTKKVLGVAKAKPLTGESEQRDAIIQIVTNNNQVLSDAKPLKKNTSETKKTELKTLDLRAVYKNGGTDSVSEIIDSLKVQELKDIIADQEITSRYHNKGKRKDQLKKFIQLALKEELGDFGDPIGALAALPRDP